jgi:hypothetical protein
MDYSLVGDHLNEYAKRRNLSSIFGGSTGSAQGNSGQTLGSLLASIVTGLVLFAVQVVIFLLLRIQFTRL